MAASEPATPGDQAPVPVRDASTVVVVRDATDGSPGIEVLMLQRNARGTFASAYVFPGGTVDATDSSLAFESCCDLDDETASARLGIEIGGLAFFVAAVRECFEEAGLLLARRAGSAPGDGRALDDPVLAARLAVARHELHGGRLSLDALCAAEGLVLATADIHHISRWITPPGQPRRFDTRFFAAPAPLGQSSIHDDSETVDSLWVRPEAALERQRSGDLLILPPTIAVLGLMSGHASMRDALAAAAASGVPGISSAQPVFEDGELTGVMVNGDFYEMRRPG